MKFILIVCFVSFSLFHFGHTAVSVLPNATHKDYPNKCYYSKVNPPLILNKGESTTIKEMCKQANCNSDLSMDFATCGAIGYPPNCKLTKIDQTKDYPDCCPTVECNEEDTAASTSTTSTSTTSTPPSTTVTTK